VEERRVDTERAQHREPGAEPVHHAHRLVCVGHIDMHMHPADRALAADLTELLHDPPVPVLRGDLAVLATQHWRTDGDELCPDGLGGCCCRSPTAAYVAHQIIDVVERSSPRLDLLEEQLLL